MAFFRYRAIGGDGTRVAGVRESPDLRSFLTTMRSGGYVVLEVREIRTRQRTRDPARVRLSALEKSQAFHEISVMLSSGIPLRECLASVAAEAGPQMALVLDHMAANLDAGVSLSQTMMALPSAFSSVEAYIASSGERTGAMDRALEDISAFLKREADARAQLRAAMAYPLMVLSVTAIVLGVIAGVVVPVLSEVVTLNPSSLPLPGRLLVALPSMARSYWWAPVTLVAAAAAFVRQLASTDDGRRRLEGLVRRAPVFGDALWSGALAKFARTLALLIESGVPVSRCFMLAGNATGLSSLRAASAILERSVESGNAISRSMEESGIFPPFLCRMVLTGEKSGKLAAALEEAARYYQSRYEEGLKSLAQKLEPFVTLVLAVVVGLVGLALMSVVGAVASSSVLAR